jgi:nucleotide-binding universal stress UspA family protein
VFNVIQNILVPVDGSKNSERALELACDLGSKFEINLVILHVIPNPAGTQAGLEKAVTAVQKPDKVATAYGSVAAEIVKYAKENKTDMIVMGSRGLSDFAGFFMDSVFHKVSHLSECSCVTVH